MLGHASINERFAGFFLGHILAGTSVKQEQQFEKNGTLQ